VLDREAVRRAYREMASLPSARQATPTAAGARAGLAQSAHGAPAIVREFLARVGADNLTLVAAGVAFYAMFGLFPGLAALVALYGLLGDTHLVQAQVAELSGLMPGEAARLLDDYLKGLLARPASHLNLALVVAIGLALWGARAGTAALMTGLNIAFEEKETRSFLTQQLVALALTLAGLVFALVAMTAIAGVPLALAQLPLTDATRNMLALARWPLLLVFVLLGFGVCYRFGPSRSLPRWNPFSAGSIGAALLWLVGSALFSTYVGRFGSYDATYGSLGAAVVLLLWFWLSAVLVLCGATFDAVVEQGRRHS
jgi:membrane protein